MQQHGSGRSVSFTLPGKPQAKARPIATARHGRTRVYTPPQTVAYEAQIAAAAQAALGDNAMIEGAVEIDIVVRLEPAKWVSAAARSGMLSGDVRATKRPDLDNVVKTIIDGCCGVVFSDDASITKISARKIYAVSAGVDVAVVAAT